MEPPADAVARRLADLRGRDLDDPALADEAVALAEDLLRHALAARSAEERRRAARLDALTADPAGLAFTTALCDRAFRSRRPARVADQLRHLLDALGAPRAFAAWERAALHVGAAVAGIAPAAVAPLLVARLRQETRAVILPGEADALAAYLARRRGEGVRLNLNQLGEAILGEEEALRRVAAYRTLLARPDVDYVSVKISSITSLIDLAAPERTLDVLCERLRTLYRAAAAHRIRRADGRAVAGFVNLDMEEYRDLRLTVAAFRRVLDEEEFRDLSAGLALQAYLPDSWSIQRELTAWARERRARGGAAIKVRIVKGANLAMERLEAGQHGWPQASYATKHDVDANFKRMLAYGCVPEHADAVRLGVGSHNLFDVAYALVLRAASGVEAQVEVEMLEGMAPPQARAVHAAAGGLLLYAPVVERRDFTSAIAYLVRRFDENAGAENFLRAVFGMTPGSPAWQEQRERFLAAWRDRHAVSDRPRRSQDRRDERWAVGEESAFANVADTDWSLPANQRWVADVVARWRSRSPERPIPLVIDGEEVRDRELVDGRDPAAPGAIAYRHAVASVDDVDRALAAAGRAHDAWSRTTVAERRRALLAAAAELQRRRGDLLGVMLRDGGKTVRESDGEISEAVDFAAYYARALDDPDLLDGCALRSRGVVVVAPPWNFPVSIPLGGVLGALMAGNAAILKPAPESVWAAWEAVQALWAAGVPRAAAQFLPCRDDAAGRALIADPRVATVALTGGSATAELFLSWRPELRLHAETGGKNAIIVTGMADRDQAILDLVRSAFAHAGQKCSAASLAILEAEVYDDPAFRRQLRDAASSLPVGPAGDPWHRVTPLIRAPGPELERALTTVDEGEEWLLEPRRDPDNPWLWSPGIKLGVRPGSFFHRTECFGPVLGVMRADDLDHALALADATPYGLTGGLHSLDEREQARWAERVRVGNGYVNRGITGAIVRRQPFGGWKRSGFGPGAKAGGPDYVLGFARLEQARPPRRRVPPTDAVAALQAACAARCPGEDARAHLATAAESDAWAWRTWFGRAHDPSRVPGEANVLRYRPLAALWCRLGAGGAVRDALRVALAARCCGVPLTISATPEHGDALAFLRDHDVAVHEQDDAACAAALRDAGPAPQRLRLLGAASGEVLRAAHERAAAVVDDPVVATGRIELRWYVREQALSVSYHRYGSPGLGPPRWLDLEDGGG